MNKNSIENKELMSAILSKKGDKSNNNLKDIIAGYEIKFPENVHVDFEVVKGIRYPRVAWKDIVEMFPEKWVMFVNYELVDDERDFISTIIEICCDEVEDSEQIRLLREGYNIGSMRTTDGMVIGIM